MIQSTKVKISSPITFYQSTFSQLPKWLEDADTSQLTRLSSLFWNCFSLEKIILPNWNVEKVLTFERAFDNCSVLTEIDISNWNAYQGQYFSISGCPYLHTLKWNHFGEFHYLTTKVDFSSCPLGTGGDESVKSVRDTFVKNSFDRTKETMYKSLVVTFNANTMALFTEEEIAEMTAKGYTIS